MSTLAVMQPTYIPWAGYFNLIKNSDFFVLLDDVDFEKQSWQTRNRILQNGKETLLSIPVKKSPLGTNIKSIQVDDLKKWRKKHISSLNQAYSKAIFKNEIIPQIINIIENLEYNTLVSLNTNIITCICSLLDISTPLFRSSDLNCSGKRSDYLISLCKHFDVDIYLSPLGAKDYLEEDSFEEKSKIKLDFQNYKPSLYEQYKSSDFISHLSIIDVIANIGIDETKKYIG